MSKDTVHTVEAYWDGPIAGVANFSEKPHYYDVVEDDAEDADSSLLYTLIPLNEEIFESVMENWAIWQRWYKAHEAGETSLDTHPALPEDKDNYNLLKKKIDSFLFQNRDKSFIKKGKFTVKENAPSLNFTIFEVEWS